MSQEKEETVIVSQEKEFENDLKKEIHDRAQSLNEAITKFKNDIMNGVVQNETLHPRIALFRVEADELLDIGTDALDEGEIKQKIRTLDVIEQNLVVARTESNVTNVNTPNNLPSYNPMKLPAVELKQFSGNSSEWLSWRSRFKTTVESRIDLSDAQKAAFLQTAISGDAKQMIEDLKFTEDLNDFKLMMEHLEKRYGSVAALSKTYTDQIKKLTESTDVPQIRRNFDTIRSAFIHLQRLEENKNYDYLVTDVLDKFDDKLIEDAFEHFDIDVGKPLPEIKKIIDAIGKRVVKKEAVYNYKHLIKKQREEEISTSITVASTSYHSSLKRPNNFSASISNMKKRTYLCILCNDGHNAKNCTKYKTVTERRVRVGQLSLCLVCSGPYHLAKDCRKRLTMSCRTCGGRHLDMFCYKNETPGNSSDLYQSFNASTSSANNNNNSQRPVSKNNNQQEKTNKRSSGGNNNNSNYNKKKKFQNGNVVNANDHNNSNSGTIFATFICKIRINDKIHLAKGLFDSGAGKSFIKQDFVIKNLSYDSKVEMDKIQISTFGSATSISHETFNVKIILINHQGKEKIITVTTIPTLLNTFDTSPHPNVIKEILPTGFRYADYELFQYKRSNIVLLIGNNFLNSFIDYTCTYRVSNDLVIFKTFFGWIPSGSITSSKMNDVESSINFCSTSSSNKNPPSYDDDNINLFNKLFSLENLGIKESEMSTNDEVIIKRFRESMYRDDDRFVVRWPWISLPPRIHNNYRLCIARFRSTYLSMSKEIKLKCNTLFEEQLKNEIIEFAPLNSPYVKHYLPHRPLIQKEKIREVYDASAKTGTNASLNQLLHAGPSLINNSIDLLIRFRWYNYAVTSDIEKAFHQIKLNEVDRDVTRFIWVKDINEPFQQDNIIIYRFQRVPFGVVASPFLLNICLQDLLAESNLNPILKNAAQNFYVDNFVISFPTVKEAITYFDAIVGKLGEAKFKLRDWLSNSKSFNNYVPECYRLKNQQEKISVLGYWWNATEDNISIKFDFNNSLNEFNRRSVLSLISSVYDPLGLISPCLLDGKVFMQKTWNLDIKKFNWKTPLPPEMKILWSKIVADLKTINLIKILRFLWNKKMEKNTYFDLHIFCDASKKAFACVAYVVKRIDNFRESSIIFSKLKLPPAKLTRMGKDFSPRLELLGVLTGVRIILFLRKLNLPKFENTFLWTDATTVLYWLNSTKIYGPFVQNRLNEIKAIKNITIRYTPREYNPADIPTQGMCAKELIINKLWWHGPKWLLDNKENWPSCVEGCSNYDSNNSTLVLAIHTIEPKISNELEKSASTWSGLVEIYIKKIGEYKHDFWLSSDLEQYQQAEQKLIKHIQHKYFNEILNNLKNTGRNLTNKYDTILNLGLMLDDKNIIHCKGRLGRSLILGYDEKHPILLSSKSPAILALLKEIHTKNHHVGVEHTLAESRKRFWIPKARTKIKLILKYCKDCLRWYGGPYKLLQMPDLPTCRTSSVQPFKFTGIDYIGPFYRSKCDNTTCKIWICLFVCLNTRAIWMELVNSCSANDFLTALESFCATRGTPSMILSDNAKNFTFIQPLLGEKVKLEDVALKEYSTRNGIDWSFVPKLCPWYGGVYERLVKVVKTCIFKGYGDKLLNFVNFSTTIKNISHVVNSRPLTYVGNDIEHPLTPNHFLHVSNPSRNKMLTVKYGKLSSSELIKGWRAMNAITKSITEVFISRYLLSLREKQTLFHPSSKGASTNIPQIGDIVLIKRNNLHRGEWPCGKIVQLNSNKSRATVRTSKQDFDESVCHLFPVEMAGTLQFDKI